jgi:hypothetical protein
MKPTKALIKKADWIGIPRQALIDILADVPEDELRPLSEWHEDIGAVLWWVLPISEPPYVGSPLDLGKIVARIVDGSKVLDVLAGGWPGYHTHWSPIPKVEVP